MRGEDLNFSEKGVGEVASKLVGRLTNVLTFYELYNSHNNDIVSRYSESKNVLDRWILARLHQTIGEVTAGMESYELDKAARPLLSFVEDFSTWYVRRSRDRFKNEGTDAAAALETTRYVLETFSKIAAPFIPFTAEFVFQKVKGRSAPESVHLSVWPKAGKVDALVLADMAEVRKVVSEALELRQKANIKVRQPLALFSTSNDVVLKPSLKILVMDEVNVKDVVKAETTALDTNITDALKKEGELRDLVREIQDLRKTAGLAPKEKAILVVSQNKKELVSAYWQELAKMTNLAGQEEGPSLNVHKA